MGADAAAVCEAFASILAAAAEHAPDARIDGCLVAPMVAREGVETILGVTMDEVFEKEPELKKEVDERIRNDQWF